MAGGRIKLETTSENALIQGILNSQSENDQQKVDACLKSAFESTRSLEANMQDGRSALQLAAALLHPRAIDFLLRPQPYKNFMGFISHAKSNLYFETKEHPPALHSALRAETKEVERQQTVIHLLLIQDENLHPTRQFSMGKKPYYVKAIEIGMETGNTFFLKQFFSLENVVRFYLNFAEKDQYIFAQVVAYFYKQNEENFINELRKKYHGLDVIFRQHIRNINVLKFVLPSVEGLDKFLASGLVNRSVHPDGNIYTEAINLSIAVSPQQKKELIGVLAKHHVLAIYLNLYNLLRSSVFDRNDKIQLYHLICQNVFQNGYAQCNICVAELRILGEELFKLRDKSVLVYNDKFELWAQQSIERDLFSKLTQAAVNSDMGLFKVLLNCVRCSTNVHMCLQPPNIFSEHYDPSLQTRMRQIHQLLQWIEKLKQPDVPRAVANVKQHLDTMFYEDVECVLALEKFTKDLNPAYLLALKEHLKTLKHLPEKTLNEESMFSPLIVEGLPQQPSAPLPSAPVESEEGVSASAGAGPGPDVLMKREPVSNQSGILRALEIKTTVTGEDDVEPGLASVSTPIVCTAATNTDRDKEEFLRLAKKFLNSELFLQVEEAMGVKHEPDGTVVELPRTPSSQFA